MHFVASRPRSEVVGFHVFMADKDLDSHHTCEAEVDAELNQLRETLVWPVPGCLGG